MSTTATRRGGDFVLPPAGTHIARCYAIVDLGTQKVIWQNQTKLQPKVHIRFELCHEMMEPTDGGMAKPFSVGMTVTNSTDPKANLRHHLEAWAGRNMTDAEEQAFDLTKLAGKACQVTVSHDKSKDGSKTFANIKAITPLAKGMKAPEMINSKLVYAVEDGKNEVYKGLSEYLQGKIAECEEWTHPADAPSTNEDAPPPADDDPNIPF